jgi:hypothetical protein
MSVALNITTPYLLCQTDDPQGEAEPFKDDLRRHFDLYPAAQWDKEKGGESTAADVAAYVRSQRRDMFAAAALTGMLASREKQTWGVSDLGNVVANAWDIADAMLEADKEESC